jgi:nitroreductase
MTTTVDGPMPSRSIDTDDAILRSLMYRRHSCRAFTAVPVPRATIVQILEVAQRTASWGNVQPWRLWVTAGAATECFRRALVEIAERSEGRPDLPFPREYRDEYLARRRAAALKLFESVGASTRRKSAQQVGENFRLYGAPHVAIVTCDEALGVYGAIDCGAYVGNFMLAAESLGVSSIAQASVARYSEFVRKHFGLPDDRQVVCAISFGYEDASHPANAFRTTRADVDDVVTWVEE